MGATRLSLIVGLVVLMAACGGSPPDQAGVWSAWSPDDSLDIPNDDRVSGYSVHFGAMVSAVAGIAPSEPDRIQPSMTLYHKVVGGEAPGITRVDVFVNCESISQYQGADFDPPLSIADDGSFEVDLGFVKWEGQFSGSEEFSGSWETASCGGSWAVVDGDVDTGGGFSIPDDD